MSNIREMILEYLPEDEEVIFLIILPMMKQL